MISLSKHYDDPKKLLKDIEKKHHKNRFMMTQNLHYPLLQSMSESKQYQLLIAKSPRKFHFRRFRQSNRTLYAVLLPWRRIVQGGIFEGFLTMCEMVCTFGVICDQIID